MEIIKKINQTKMENKKGWSHKTKKTSNKLQKGDIFKVIQKDHTTTGSLFKFIGHTEKGIKAIKFPNYYGKSDPVTLTNILPNGIKVLTTEETDKISRNPMRKFGDGGSLKTKKTSEQIRKEYAKSHGLSFIPTPATKGIGLKEANKNYLELLEKSTKVNDEIEELRKLIRSRKNAENTKEVWQKWHELNEEHAKLERQINKSEPFLLKKERYHIEAEFPYSLKNEILKLLAEFKEQFGGREWSWAGFTDRKDPQGPFKTFYFYTGTPGYTEHKRKIAVKKLKEFASKHGITDPKITYHKKITDYGKGGGVDSFVDPAELYTKWQSAEMNFSKDGGAEYNKIKKQINENSDAYYKALNDAEANWSKDNGAEYKRLIAMKSKFDKGGNLPDKYVALRNMTPEEVWSKWTANQRYHFLADHFPKVGSIKTKQIADYDYEELNFDIKDAIIKHVSQDKRYLKGGGVNSSSYKFEIVDFYADVKSLDNILDIVESLVKKGLDIKVLDKSGHVSGTSKYKHINSVYVTSSTPGDVLIRKFYELRDHSDNHIHMIEVFKKGGLTGGQHKLDVNKNGKIDAEDFKMLRSSKMETGGGVGKQKWIAVYANKQKPNEQKVITAHGNTGGEAYRDAEMSRPHYGVDNKYELVRLYTYSSNSSMKELGGSVESENADMVMNDARQIAHHAGELMNVLGNSKHVPAWVVAKIHSASEDLSAATHFLGGEAGMTEYGNGGKIGNGANGYVAMYKGKKLDVYANTTYEAQQLAAKEFKAKKPWEVSIYLTELNGKPYVHSTASFENGGDINN